MAYKRHTLAAHIGSLVVALSRCMDVEPIDAQKNCNGNVAFRANIKRNNDIYRFQ